MNVKATDEIVGDPNRPKTRITDGIYFQPAANLRAERLRYEMQPPFLFPPIQNQSERQRELVDLTAWVDVHTQALCDIPAIRQQIEAATLQAMTHGIGWVGIDAATGDSIAALDLWVAPTEPENAAALRIPPEAVYLDLVRAESNGHARVVVESYGHETPTRYWQAW